MKISELIQCLEKIKSEDSDLELYVNATDSNGTEDVIELTNDIVNNIFYKSPIVKETGWPYIVIDTYYN